jgi:hypothetical protein
MSVYVGASCYQYSVVRDNGEGCGVGVRFNCCGEEESHSLGFRRRQFR